jgi:hypothetical protein
MRTNKISKTVESDIETNNKNIRNSNPQMMLCSNYSLAITYEMDPIRDEEATYDLYVFLIGLQVCLISSSL